MFNNLSFLESSEFWKAIAFVLSVAIVIYPAYLFVIKKAQERNKKIVAQFESALNLEHQAKEALDAAQKKLENIDADKQKIMSTAKFAAESLKEEADLNLQSILLRREKENEERVGLIRENGLRQLQDKFLEIAIDTTQTVLTDDQIMSKSTVTELGLKELESILQDKKNLKLLQNSLLEEG